MGFASEFGFVKMPRAAKARDKDGAFVSASSSPLQTENTSVQQPKPRVAYGQVDVTGECATTVASAANKTLTENSATVSTRDALNGAKSAPSTVELERAYQHYADRLAEVRGLVMVATEHDARTCNLILDSLPQYGQATRAVRELHALTKKSERQLRQITTTYFSRLTTRTDTALTELRTYLSSLTQDPIALRQLIQKLQHTAATARQRRDTAQGKRTLAERRAFLRTAVRQVLLRMKQFPELAVEDRALREQLHAFTVLDDLPNWPESNAEQKQLERTLERLEPKYEELKAAMQSVLERPLPDSSAHNDDEALRQAVAAWSQEADGDSVATTTPTPHVYEDAEDVRNEAMPSRDTVSAASSVFADAPGVVANQSGVTEQNDPKIQQHSALDAITQNDAFMTQNAGEDAAAPLGEAVDRGGAAGLGMYTLQRGDTLADFLYGETAAGILPAMVEIPSSHVQTLVNLVRTYIDNYRAVREYLGLPDSIDTIAMWAANHPAISLDAFNDVIIYVATEHQLLFIDEMVWERLSARFRELEDRSRALQQHIKDKSVEFTPRSVRQTAHGVARGVRWAARGRPKADTGTKRITEDGSMLPQQFRAVEEQAILSHYQGDSEAYYFDCSEWITTLFVPPRDEGGMIASVLGRDAKSVDPVDDFLRLSFQEWTTLLQDSAQRYTWLQTHLVPVSTWREWSRQILSWQRTLEQLSAEDIRPVSLYTLARVAFAHELGRTQSGG